MQLDNELIKYVNNLYDQGYRAAAGEKDGISEFDQEHLIALIIKQTPLPFLPEISQLDPKNELMDLIANYMSKYGLDDMTDVMDFLVAKVVEFYKPTVQLIMEKAHERSEG